MFCPACPNEPCSHYMHCACYDMDGRPVIYSCQDLATNRNVEDNRRHMIATFEIAIKLMPPGVEQWSWVLDFHGFSIRDCNPRLARIFLHLASAHYPERLGYFFIVDPPALFSTFWQAVSPFIDPKTKSKISFLTLKKQDQLESELSKHCDSQSVQWLVREMQENRDGRRNSKHYSYGALAKMIEDGNVPDFKGEHCNLGAPGYLSALISRPGQPSQFRRMELSGAK